MVTRSLLMGVLLAMTTLGTAQTKRELSFITRHNPLPHLSSAPGAVSFRRQTSETKLLALGMIRGYQIFVSSQQSERVCTFTPSCSQFGFAAIQTYGTLPGILMASDRLQRCNGLSAARLYAVNKQTGKFNDPLAPYYLPFKLK